MTEAFTTERLAALDGQGYVVLEALTAAPLAPSASHSRPNAFVAIDGKTYWLKGNVQQGLVAELIAGRLASNVGAGPIARVIRVTAPALPPGGAADHLEGVVCGVEHLEGVVNARELQPFIASGQLPPGAIDPPSRARAVVFQTWLGLRDQQVLVSLTTGHVYSIDHGDCFGDLSSALPIRPVITSIPGVADSFGNEPALVSAVVKAIEAVSDGNLLHAVSQVPSGDAWRSPTDRRLRLAAWLAERRDNLGAAMAGWRA